MPRSTSRWPTATLQPDGAQPGNFRFGASGLLDDIVTVLGSSTRTDVGGVLMSSDNSVFLPQEVIRTKRDGGRLPEAVIERFVRGITDGSVGDTQVAAFAMAVFFQGMDIGEHVALTTAMLNPDPRCNGIARTCTVRWSTSTRRVGSATRSA